MNASFSAPRRLPGTVGADADRRRAARPAQPGRWRSFAQGLDRAVQSRAARHGNGVVEVTARGSLQIRGLTPDPRRCLPPMSMRSASRFAPAYLSRPEPLAGLDPDEIADPTPLAENIRAAIVAAGLEGRLGPKVSVVVDGGGRSGLDEVAADVRLTAVRQDAETLAACRGG